MKVIVGDLLENVTHDAIIVHGCNAQGVMGGGFALQVKNKYPRAYEKYREFLQRCVTDFDMVRTEQALGGVMFVDVGKNLHIANAITQDKFGTNTRHANYEAIACAFEHVAKMSDKLDLPIHYPMIGAGLAGGNWNIISTIIDTTLMGYDHTLWTLK
jgi:O-acetyl-ADP-ribose deacetylase (regulator of RNase III)